MRSRPNTEKPINRILHLALALLIVLPGAAAWAQGAPDPAVQRIDAFYMALTGVMANGAQLGLKGRYDRLAPAIRQTFDIPAMARLSVGPAWSMMTEADQKAVTDAFERMTIANYAKNFASASGDHFTVQPMAQSRGGDKIVESALSGPGHAPVAFNYRMHETGNDWKVVDIYLNGFVSQLAVRRSDFAATVASSGAAGLVKKIDALSDRIMAGG
jgi:phospholipid transport system substrate-binding protein